MRDTLPSSRSFLRKRGFTLVEVLVVLTIIVLISLSALPAIRFITGSRSIESTQNLAGSMISRARGQALADGEPRGVFFFLDPATDRTTMALVGQGGGDFDQYLGWTSNSPPGALDARFDLAANSPVASPYYPSGTPGVTESRVISLSTGFGVNGVVNLEGNQFYLSLTRPRSIVRSFACINQNSPTDANKPKIFRGNSFWLPASTALDLVADTDFQQLPAGVGVQLINSNPTGRANFDRYLRMGCIMFDRNGFFTSVPWSVASGTPLGKAMHLAADLDIPPAPLTAPPPLYSQFGLALYDRQTYLAQQNAGNNFVEGDFIFKGIAFQPGLGPKFPASFADEDAKEKWLDNNSLPLLIDRYSGNLIKGE